MRNGEIVAAFECAFAEYVGARYAIALCNGTATLHTALVALGVKPGDRVAVPPLTMSATTSAVLQAGAVPVFCDVDPATWLMKPPTDAVAIGVSLYGLHYPAIWQQAGVLVDDAAQTLRPHSGCAFTSYSFQASKILALGEGGMLVTNDEALATRAREFSSLGYRMRADQPRIDPAALKLPNYERHHSLGFNYRMNDLTAAEGLKQLARADFLLATRQACANLYREAIAGCDWLTSQHVPEGWTHDYWCWAVAIASSRPPLPFNLVECYPTAYAGWPGLWARFADCIVEHGGERPFGAWRLTYHEPAFRHLASDGTCPIAESLQPRLLQFQTNNLASAERNATALHAAIREIGG